MPYPRIHHYLGGGSHSGTLEHKDVAARWHSVSAMRDATVDGVLIGE